MGIPPNRLIMGKQLVFARKALLIETGECSDPNPFVLNMFRKMCTKYFSLSTEPPEKYVIYNRNFGPKRLCRRLLNIEDLLMVIHRHERFQKYDFILYDDNRKLSVKQQAQFYSTIKLLFAVDGAGLGNTLFMQDHTALIQIFVSTNHNYIGFFLVAMSNCRIFIGFRDYHIQLTRNSPNVFSSSKFIQILQLGLEKLEDERFLNSTFEYETSLLTIKNLKFTEYAN